MPQTSKPRCGSLQFWPHKRAKREYPRIRSFVTSKANKLLGFPGYKAGMTNIQHIDSRKETLTKGEQINCPVTVIECPNIKISSIRFYKNDPAAYGLKVIGEVSADKQDKELQRKIKLHKQQKHKLEDFKDFDELRVNVHTMPKLAGFGKKKPELFELKIGGSKEEQLKFATAHLGKEINVSEVFQPGQQVDVHSITKGQGFQGVVTKHGVSLRQHKSEKSRRAAVTAPEGINKVKFTAPMAGKIGYHLRTEYNKWVMKVSDKLEEVNPKGGFVNYGLIKNSYVLLKGSVPGHKKRMILLTDARRPNRLIPKNAPDITYTSTDSKQGK